MNRLIIRKRDFALLSQLDSDTLREELDRAEIVADHEVPAGIVTMHARVRYLDETTGERTRVTLVYPHQTDMQRGRISVLAPVGAALLGLASGDAIEWPFPHGIRRLRVEKVVQPPRTSRRTSHVRRSSADASGATHTRH